MYIQIEVNVSAAVYLSSSSGVAASESPETAAVYLIRISGKAIGAGMKSAVARRAARRATRMTATTIKMNASPCTELVYRGTVTDALIEKLTTIATR